ncbi:uncharacterized protein LOC117640931 [Thrips palmi]|uniref:Uncharacterized protein LOC117640931 n=1 Tax=Thrips palmi TaxID=161013 RepID=A0A6P8YIW2_THRPL|nr:uncharacterized protein LOC117640931 [Thrips palmi]
MAAALALLALLAASAVADPLGAVAVDNKSPLGFDLNELLAKLLAAYDPFHVARQQFDVDLKEIRAKGYADNIVITGVSGLRLLKVALNELGAGKAEVSLHLPAINVVGDYEVTGAVLQPLQVPLDSAGKFTFGVTELEVDASVELGISDEGQILLKDFKLPYWNLTEIELNLEGLLSGYALGQMINDILHDTLTHIVTKAYHDKLTTLVTTNVVTEGGKYLASLHRDHGHPAFQSGGPQRVEAAVVPQPARTSSSADRELSSKSATWTGRTDLLSLVGLDTEALGVSGMFTLDLAAPQLYPHGTLLSADSDEPAARGVLAMGPSDIREAAVDDLFGVQLAPAQFYRHGELSSGSESAPAGSYGVQILEGMQGLLSGHGVKFEPAKFYERGYLSRNQDAD